MDPQKSAANRVRHILQAMERSIDTARSRRVGHPSSSEAPQAPERIAPMHEPQRMHASQPAAMPASTMVGQTAPPSPSQRMIGAPAAGTAAGHAPITRPSTPHLTGGDGQPPRLKAKPKRFEGNVNSAFSPPPAYRSQVG